MKYYGRNAVWLVENVVNRSGIIRNIVNKNMWGLECYILACSV